MKPLATTALTIAVSLLLGSAASADITVCNEFLATIHVTLANQEGGSYTAAGWWTVPKNSCQDVDFTLQGDTLHYTADSDDYKSGRDTKHDHWGNKVQLFVGSRVSKKFSFTNAEKSRPGAKPEMFSSATMTQQPQPKAVAITVHFKQGGTSIDFTPRLTTGSK
jgi:uncharacterized membrane protein